MPVNPINEQKPTVKNSLTNKGTVFGLYVTMGVSDLKMKPISIFC